MEHNPAEEKAGMNWLFGAGFVAVAVACFLAWADYRMIHSPGEKQLGETLYELRKAQTSLNSDVTDPRQLTAVDLNQASASKSDEN